MGRATGGGGYRRGALPLGGHFSSKLSQLYFLSAQTAKTPAASPREANVAGGATRRDDGSGSWRGSHAHTVWQRSEGRGISVATLPSSGGKWNKEGKAGVR